MISVDFSFAIAFYIFIFLNIVLVSWVFSRKQKDKNLTLDQKFIWHCFVCSYAYINTKEDIISICPRCGSYNKKAV